MPQTPRTPPKPPWLRRRLAPAGAGAPLERGLGRRGLFTICREGACPNRGECFARGAAAFLILGPVCTRGCRFCAVRGGAPAPPDPGEPERLAEQAAELGLGFVVVTSVTRDDLADGGAGQFAACLAALRRRLPGAGVELLVPDFAGSAAALDTVLAAGPEVLAHNLETVPRLYPAVRPGADYGRSLELLARAAARGGGLVKSGLMLGLGESEDEVVETLLDMRRAGCRALTLGQYLQPTSRHHPVAAYLEPAAFERYRAAARDLGFAAVAAGPLVRSSYLAEESYRQAVSRG
jgi:lipoic acid synthetase